MNLWHLGNIPIREDKSTHFMQLIISVFFIFKLIFSLSFQTSFGRTSQWFETWLISSWYKLGVNVMYMSFEVTCLDFHEYKTLILFFFCFKWHRTLQNIWLLNLPLPVSFWVSHPMTLNSKPQITVMEWLFPMMQCRVGTWCSGTYKRDMVWVLCVYIAVHIKKDTWTVHYWVGATRQMPGLFCVWRSLLFFDFR